MSKEAVALDSSDTSLMAKLIERRRLSEHKAKADRSPNEMINTVILDLDGPILDGRFRHYACYRQILELRGYEPASLERYWGMKRERASLGQVLARSKAEAIYEDFQQSWLDSIEQSHLLALDRLQPGVIEKLRQWRDQSLRLVLVTLRRHPEHLYEQLARLGLDFLLDHVVVCDHGEGGLGKARRLKSSVAGISSPQCLWVGDSEVDIEAARSFGCPIWAVACGVRAESYLASLAPDFLSPDITYVD